MSSLTAADKRYLESILGMGGGYVLDFTDATFGEFFNGYNVDIHGNQYQSYGTSKAKKMRAFWERAADDLVGRSLSDLLDTYEANCEVSGQQSDTSALTKCREIVGKLLGKTPETTMTAEGFLSKDFEISNIQKLPVEFGVSKIIHSRLKEAQACLGAEAFLAVIFLCGSVLEAVLLGAAQKEPAKFNSSQSSPKRDGKIRPFQEWSLSEFINVAYDVGLLGLDVQKFSHGLRDFRNYIHPYQQITSGFAPDEHTAKLCLQVLKAALADVSGER